MHVDLVGPLPVAEGGLTYLFTIIDRTSRWLEAVPLSEMSATACVDAFVTTWVARFGVPHTLTSDRGTQFSSATWTNLCHKLGIRHVMTTAYHPQANGLVERAHRQIKDALRARQAGTDWPSHLPWILLGLRAAPKEISGVSSAEAVFGQPLVLPGELTGGPETPPADFHTRLASEDPPLTSQPRTYAEVVSQPPNQRLQEARFVYIRKGGSSPPLAAAYTGPFEVIQPGLKFFLVKIGDRQESVTVDRLKPHQGASPITPASPPSRGRPRKQASTHSLAVASA